MERETTLTTFRGKQHRAPALPFEFLMSVALDDSQPATVRVGAVLAVAPELDDGARQRLRAAARVAASREVRFALAAASYGDHAGLMRAAQAMR